MDDPQDKQTQDPLHSEDSEDSRDSLRDSSADKTREGVADALDALERKASGRAEASGDDDRGDRGERDSGKRGKSKADESEEDEFAHVKLDDDTPRAPDFNPETIEIAKELGFTEAEARAFSSEDDLLRTLNKIATSFERVEKKSGEQDTIPPLKLEGIDLSDPEAVGTLEKALDKHVRSIVRDSQKRMGELVAYQKRLESALTQMQTAIFLSQFDDVVLRHGEPWRKLLGQDPTLDLDPDSREFKARKKLMDEIWDRAQYAGLKRQRSGSIAKLFRSVASELFGTPASTQEGERKNQERKSQLTRRPSSSSGSRAEGGNGRAATLNRVRELMVEKGLSA